MSTSLKHRSLPKTAAPFSYRDDPAVPHFDDSKPLVIFDGYCVLCSSGVAFLARIDRHGVFRMAAIQDEVPQALYAHYGLDALTFDTFMVLDNGLGYTKSAGVLHIGRRLGGVWGLLARLAGLLPKRLADWVYDVVQRNRLQWFGRREVCLRPTAELNERFLNS